MKRLFVLFGMFVILILGACGGGGDGGEDGEDGGTLPPPAASNFVVFAWNDLGMHCLNPSYDTAVILPPYNTIWAQVVERGNPPRIVTSGLTVEYRIVNNTFSSGKRLYGQFWDFVKQLFGVDVPRDRGLNLVEPDIHNGLSGQMRVRGDHFQVDGVPLTPVEDSGTWNPYQIAEITVKDSGGQIVAQTQATVPTSDEINCSKCHGADPFRDILQKHDAKHGTTLLSRTPVLCAECHGSPILGSSSAGVKYLSEAIHKSHADRNATCYDCHPGEQTACNRSLRHTAQDGNCTACHGSMAQVASSIVSGRVPWAQEPKCSQCHGGIQEVDTGTTLYRNAKGHGSLYCASCHSSPHAMVPSRVASDNHQALQYQGKEKTIGSCGVCHGNSRGPGISEFGEVHGGANPDRRNACHVCHTAVSTNTGLWPHAFQWKSR